MLEKKIRILNFDDSVAAQKGLLSRYEAEVIDMRDLGPRARLWITRATGCEIKKRIPDQNKCAVTFLGSGDFHHVTELLLKRYDEPISVIDFDFHPDWDKISPFLHCGSWVAEAMKNGNVAKLVVIGASPRDLSLFSIQTADLGSLANDRVEIYPYSCRPSKVLFRTVPRNISFETKRYPFLTKICWNELRNKNITEFFLHIVRRIPTKKVYVTIDKDCLETSDALTNWDHGGLSLEDLLDMLKIIKDNLDIVGMDIAGDYSSMRVGGVFKNIVSRLIRPGNIKAERLPPEKVTALNEATNLKILDRVTGPSYPAPE